MGLLHFATPLPETTRNETKQNQNKLEVLRFKEKPELNLAKKYFKNPNFFWNSGIFLFKAKTFIEELKIYEPKIFEISSNTIKSKKISSNFISFDKTFFSKCPNKSIDYAVMEHSKELIMLPLKTIWSDLGTWHSLIDLKSKDVNKNVKKGNLVIKDTKNSTILSMGNRLVAVNGVDDLIIIDTKDSLLVSSKKESGNITPLVNNIKKKERSVVQRSLDENRPWGFFETICSNKDFKVKKITVKPGGQLSIQKHKYRSDHWVVVSGIAEVFRGSRKIKLNVNQSIDKNIDTNAGYIT